MSAVPAERAPAWQDQVLPGLKSFNLRHLAPVPDAGHAATLRAVPPPRDGIHLTNRFRAAPGHSTF